MIMLKQHTVEQKANIVKALDLVSAANKTSSEYTKIMRILSNREDQWLTNFEEINTDVTALFIEGITHKQLYNHFKHPNMPFFDKNMPYSGFVIDSVVDYIFGNTDMSGSEKYYHLTTLSQIAIYLYDNPIKEGQRIDNGIIDKAKNYQSKQKMFMDVEGVLMEASVENFIIDQVKAVMLGEIV